MSNRTLVANTVDVRRFPDHQPAVIDAWLHPVVAHYEKDVGFLLLRGSRHARCHQGGKQCEQTKPDFPGCTHLI